MASHLSVRVFFDLAVCHGFCRSDPDNLPDCLAAAQPTSQTNILCDFSKINEVHREDPWGGWRGKLKPLTYIS